ncbi:MAG: hypothetical protein V7752_01180 [Halopseudomonas sp.]
MTQASIRLKAEQQQNSRKQRRRERAMLLLICSALLAMVGFGIIYGTSFNSSATIKPKQEPSRMSQACQRKLLDHIKKGGADLVSEMNYGNLQGCNFSSEAEQTAQLEDSKRGGWGSVNN